MTRGRFPRPGCRRLLVCLVLTLATLVAPLESGLLPSAIPELAGRQAAAQLSTVQPGQADPCEEGWEADGDSCRIERFACPSSPFDPSRQMHLSTEFPEFCEETVQRSVDPDNYGRCAAPLQAFVVIDDGETCRALQLRTCEIGTRIDSDLCRATKRRSWNCNNHLTRAIPRNQFNSCYVVPTNVRAPDAACTNTAPDLVVIKCTDYVGTDFVEPPSDAPCDSYDTGNAPAMTDSANQYWCSFNPSYLKIVCHGDAPSATECSPTSTAMCLKRASGTGGCDGIAQTMFCRDQQHSYDAQHSAALDDNTIDQRERSSLQLRAINVRQEYGCEPCLILPFEPVPQHCPLDTREEIPGRFPGSPGQFQALHQRQSINLRARACQHLQTFRTDVTMGGCADAEPVCDTPTSGNPTWSSTHFSGAAVTNSSVIVQLHDVPSTYRSRPSSLSLAVLKSGNLNWGSRREYAEYPGSGLAPSGQLVRTWSEPPAELTTGSTADLANRTSECIVLFLPLFRLSVEELWPDRREDAEAIASLFGPEALDWWNHLAGIPGAQERLTERRGLPWWPDLETPEQRAARTELLETRIDCRGEQDIPVWCRWVPSRSGYYRLKVGGGWLMSVGRSRNWKSDALLNLLSTQVQALDQTEREQVIDSLVELGCGPAREPHSSCALSPVAVGLRPDLSDIIRPSEDSDELYRLSGEGHRYGGFDLRVDFSDTGSSAKYTETQELGVQVHEVRTSTVTPSR